MELGRVKYIATWIYNITQYITVILHYNSLIVAGRIKQDGRLYTDTGNPNMDKLMVRYRLFLDMMQDFAFQNNHTS